MDWKQLISEIAGHGLSQPQIAVACGCGQATISDLAQGRTKDPRDSLGQALRTLHAKVTQSAVDPVALAAMARKHLPPELIGEPAQPAGTPTTEPAAAGGA